jgi:hypothetical protein
MKYTGIECPVCNKPFAEGDDIVVCPECGAPYHRECYHAEGHCIFSEKHSKGESWNPPSGREVPPEGSSSTNDAQRTKICPRCSTRNYPDALFCDKCGLPFVQNTQAPSGFPGPFQQGGYPGQPMPFALDPMGGVNPEETMDGCAAGDLAKYVKVTTPYYLPIFKKIKDTQKSRFNFSAFLFTGGWMLYRKQYKWGIPITLLMFCVLLGSALSSLYLYEPLQLLTAAAGLDYNKLVLDLPTMALLMQHLDVLSGWQYFLVYLPFLCSIVQLLIMILIGIKGNRIYYRHCVEKVTALREQTNGGAAFEQVLQTSGGVNMPLAISLMVCYMMIYWLPILFL